MVQTIPVSSECWLEFKFPVQRRRAARQSTPGNPKRFNRNRNMKSTLVARLLCNDGNKVASFGATKLIRHRGGRWELCGGSPVDHEAAREWSSHIQHEATFPSASSPQTAEQSKSSNAPNKRILIADDDSVVRGSLAAVLQSEGYEVDEARNGTEAVNRAIEHS